MESPSTTARRVTFETLRNRLIKQVKLQVDNGQFSERGLARMLGISQSQTHKVLDGSRALQVQLADKILEKLDISTLNLYSKDELQQILRQKLSIHHPKMWLQESDEFSTHSVNSETVNVIRMPVQSVKSSVRLRGKRAG